MAQIKVLIVDQDEASRKFLAQLLFKKNYDVLHARSGRTGLETAINNSPSVVIFDPNLPDLNPVEFIRGLKQNKRIAGMPCIAFSSRSDPEEMQQCLEAGCAEYYVKSGMVMITMVESIPKLLIESQMHAESEQGLLIVFLSAKGGTGTSSLCANIGMNISQHMQSSSVAVVDMVLPVGSIAPIVGSDDRRFNIVTVSELSESEISSEYFRKNLISPPHWNIHLLPGSPDPEVAGNLQVSKIPTIIETLRKTYDYVLIDLGRSLSRISMPIIEEASLVSLIFSTDLSTVTLTKTIWEYLVAQGVSAEKTYAILNRAVGLEGVTKNEAENILGLNIKLMMPYMMGNFALANNQHTPISVKYPTDTASMVLKQAAIEISQQAIDMSKK